MTSVRGTWRLWCLVLAALIVCAAAGSRVASAHNAGYVFSIYEDAFRVYDYWSTADYTDPDYIDWPVNLLFTNNAEVDKVKCYIIELTGDYGYGAQHKNARVNDGSGGMWDSDKGCKTLGTWDEHFRIYADESNDHLYNTGWGFYCIATSHRDHWDSIPGLEEYGWSETAEQMICDDFADIDDEWNLTVSRNWKWLNNYEGHGYIGNDYWQNNGCASKIRFPDSPEYVGHID